MKWIKKILLILILAVLWLPLVQENQQFFEEVELKGAFVKPKKPEFSLDSFLTQNFQKKWEEYENNNFGFRTFLIKIRNSVNYILYRELSVVDNVAGKDGFVFSRSSIAQSFGIQYQGEDRNKNTIMDIAFLKNELEKKGVKFLAVIVPSKEFIYPDHVPPPNPRQPSARNNYMDFVEGYKKNNIPFIDFCTYFKKFRDTSNYPIFTKTGFHWSMYAASLAQDSLLAYIAHSLSKQIPQYRCSGIEISDTSRIADADFEEPLNLFFSLQKGPYFYRKLDMVKSTETNFHPKVIIIGDSFFWIIKHQRVLPYIFSKDSRYWYYFKRSFLLSDDQGMEIKDVEVLEELESADFVLLFGNVATLYEFPYGITEYFKKNSSNSRKQDYEGGINSIFIKGANNKYVKVDSTHGNILTANTDTPSLSEIFSLSKLAVNKYSIFSSANKLLCAELGSQNEITATREIASSWETFTFIKLDDNHAAFKAANDKYLSVDERTLQIYARADSIGKNEVFEIIPSVKK